MLIMHESGFKKEMIIDILSRFGIRPTAQRVKIAGVLLTKDQHLSADQVLAKVNNDKSTVSKATVYNTLNLFVRKGLLRQVIVESGKVFYDSNNSTHHHLYNEDTGELNDINAGELTIENLPELPPGTIKSGIDVVIRIKNRG